jgi:hypothetical protein
MGAAASVYQAPPLISFDYSSLEIKSSPGFVSSADSDEAGHAFQSEAGHLFRSEAGRGSDLMSATLRRASTGRWR